MTGRLMLEHKGIEYRRVDLIPALHKLLLRALGFGATTVPALRIQGRRLQNTLRISRALEELQPDPPLFPADADRRARCEEAERWGEHVLQPVPRRLSWWALNRDREGTRSFLEGARIGIPIWLAARTSAPIIWSEMRINGAHDTAIRADLGALPEMLDRVDGYVADGVIGADPPNAADYQIATSIQLLRCFEDLRAGVDARPAAAFARRVAPEFPGRSRAVFPVDWLEGLR